MHGYAEATIVIPLLKQPDNWLEQCVVSAVTQTVPTAVFVVTAEATSQSNLSIGSIKALFHETHVY